MKNPLCWQRSPLCSDSIVLGRTPVRGDRRWPGALGTAGPGCSGPPALGRGAVAMGLRAAALSFILALRISALASGSKLQPHM